MVLVIQEIKHEQERVMAQVRLGVIGQVGIGQAVRRFQMFVHRIQPKQIHKPVVLVIQEIKHEQERVTVQVRLGVAGQVGIDQAVHQLLHVQLQRRQKLHHILS